MNFKTNIILILTAHCIGNCDAWMSCVIVTSCVANKFQLVKYFHQYSTSYNR